MRLPSRTGPRKRLRLRYALAGLLVSIFLGAFGFRWLEGLTWTQSFYLTVQTVTTVGYGDIPPRTPAGRIFASLFMLTGVGLVAYILSSTVQAIVQFEFVMAFDERRRRRDMRKLSNHFIICGAGRVGRRIINELRSARVPYIVIERDENKVAEFIARGDNVLLRDATLDATLREAGVERARGLASCLAQDADNVYIVLIARDLNRKLHIVARAVEEQAEPRLVKAGANRVISPIIIGSHRMAQALTKPAVADFMESITAENLDLGFEEVHINENSRYHEQQLQHTDIRAQLNVVIVAILKRDGTRLYNPTGETVLCAGDVLIAIGRAEALQELIRTARGNL